VSVLMNRKMPAKRRALAAEREEQGMRCETARENVESLTEQLEEQRTRIETLEPELNANRAKLQETRSPGLGTGTAGRPDG